MSDEETKSVPAASGEELLDVSIRDARDTALNATEAVRVTSAAIAGSIMLDAIDAMAPLIPFMDTSEKSPAKQAVKSFVELASKNPLRG